MAALDSHTLLVCSGILTLVVTLALCASGIGLRGAASGVGIWVLGDVSLSASRFISAVELPRGIGLFGMPTLLLSGVLITMGVSWHLLALQRVRGTQGSRQPRIVLPLIAAASFALPASALPTLTQRAMWLYVLLLVAAGATLVALWPLRRSWGARLIALVMLFACFTLPARLALLVLEGPQRAMPTGVVPELLDLVFGLTLSVGFMLLLQERLREHIERLMVTDALTGALNRRGLMALLDAELAQANRHARQLSVVMFDLDRFKRVNDHHGHAVGDAVLAGFASRVNALARRGDLLGRWGGEEFLLVLRDTALDEAGRLAERIRTAVADTPLAPDAPPVTVSGGVASIGERSGAAAALRAISAEPPAEPPGAPTLAALLERADRRLYRAKQQRDQVVSGD